MDLIRAIETMSFRALPAFEEYQHDGWLIRFTEGYAGRANSVNPIYDSFREDVYHKIRHCEAFYDVRNQPAMFKLTTVCQPDNLDTILDRSGYTMRENSFTQVYISPLTASQPQHNGIEITAEPLPLWFDAFARMDHLPQKHYKTLRKIFQMIQMPRAYILLKRRDEVVGVALGVLDGKWLGIYNVVVDEEHRCKGYARSIMNGLMMWGMGQGATRAYLQVTETNIVAKNLYESLDFRYLYHYWYRVKPMA